MKKIIVCRRAVSQDYPPLSDCNKQVYAVTLYEKERPARWQNEPNQASWFYI